MASNEDLRKIREKAMEPSGELPTANAQSWSMIGMVLNGYTLLMTGIYLAIHSR